MMAPAEEAPSIVRQAGDQLLMRMLDLAVVDLDKRQIVGLTIRLVDEAVV